MKFKEISNFNLHVFVDFLLKIYFLQVKVQFGVAKFRLEYSDNNGDKMTVPNQG